MGQKCKQQVTAEQYKAPSCCHCRQLISAVAPLPEEERKVQTLHLLPKEPVLLTLPAPGPPSCRYNEIAELVVVAGQSRALQQRAQRQGVTLIPAQKAGAVLKVQPARDMCKYSWRQCVCSSATAGRLLACSLPCLTPSVGSATGKEAHTLPVARLIPRLAASLWLCGFCMCRCIAPTLSPSSRKRCIGPPCWLFSLGRSRWRAGCHLLVSRLQA